MIYKDNEQIKECVLSMMKCENVTYKELGKKLETTQQNAYKMVNKNQLKFDDVLKICNALGYKMTIEILKDDGTKLKTDSQEEFMSSITEKILLITNELEKIKESHEHMVEQVEKITTEK